jgi:cell shape-determining protein MreD
MSDLSFVAVVCVLENNLVFAVVYTLLLFANLQAIEPRHELLALTNMTLVANANVALVVAVVVVACIFLLFANLQAIEPRHDLLVLTNMTLVANANVALVVAVVVVACIFLLFENLQAELRQNPLPPEVPFSINYQMNNKLSI